MIFLTAMSVVPLSELTPNPQLPKKASGLSVGSWKLEVGSSLTRSHQLAADDGGTLGERVELHLGHHARQRLHAAVAAERDLLGRDGGEHLADAGGNRSRLFDRVGTDVEHADLHALIRRQVLEELHTVHIAVGVIQHELVDA